MRQMLHLSIRNLGANRARFLLTTFAVLLGVYPESMFGMMRESMTLLVDSLDAGYQAMMPAASDVQQALLGK